MTTYATRKGTAEARKVTLQRRELRAFKYGAK